jgi:predicted phage tail protein
MATGAVRNTYTFHNLQAGVKYRIRVRAVDGQGNKGSYSSPVDIIAGIGSDSQPSSAVTGLTVTSYPLGVQVAWNAQANARGYEVYVTESSGTPPDPDPSNKAQLYYRGNATSILVKSQSGYNVKVKVLWYNQYGRLSSGVASGSGTASAAS